jgi:alpha-amylase
VVGEFWVGDREKLTEWLGKMNKKFSVFDAPLLYNFSRISTTEKADLRTVFDGSLIQVEPYNAVVSSIFPNHLTYFNPQPSHKC